MTVLYLEVLILRGALLQAQTGSTAVQTRPTDAAAARLRTCSQDESIDCAGTHECSTISTDLSMLHGTRSDRHEIAGRSVAAVSSASRLRRHVQERSGSMLLRIAARLAAGWPAHQRVGLRWRRRRLWPPDGGVLSGAARRRRRRGPQVEAGRQDRLQGHGSVGQQSWRCSRTRVQRLKACRLSSAFMRVLIYKQRTYHPAPPRAGWQR